MDVTAPADRRRVVESARDLPDRGDEVAPRVGFRRRHGKAAQGPEGEHRPGPRPEVLGGDARRDRGEIGIHVVGGDIARLAITDEAGKLAAKLVQRGAIPRKAAEDALHIAIAAAHGVDYLLTWNCRHIANATMRQAIEHVCREAGYEPPVICTPEELLNDENN